MSPMSQQTIAIKQARSPAELVNHLPKIIPESEAMFSIIMEILKKRGPAMAAGVMQIRKPPQGLLLLLLRLRLLLLLLLLLRRRSEAG